MDDNPIDCTGAFRRRAGRRCVLSPWHISRSCTISLCLRAHFISSLDWFIVLCPAASSHSLQCESVLESYRRRPALTRCNKIDECVSYMWTSLFSLLLHIHYITRPNFEPFWSKHTREVKHDTSCFVGVKIRTQYSSVNSLTWCLNPAKNSFCTCVWSTALLFLPNILLDKLHIIISVFLFVCLFYFLIFKTNYVTTNTLSRAYILLGTFVVCIMFN